MGRTGQSMDRLDEPDISGEVGAPATPNMILDGFAGPLGFLLRLSRAQHQPCGASLAGDRRAAGIRAGAGTGADAARPEGRLGGHGVVNSSAPLEPYVAALAISVLACSQMKLATGPRGSFRRLYKAKDLRPRSGTPKHETVVNTPS